ncbi:MAG TPA: TerB family tellurite resistance protein [Methylocella sp.]|nr:TerB family tellurite resistance protein [Methylocella sp.]
MFDALKRFLAEVSGAGAASRSFEEDEDYCLAAVALLIHIIHVDGSADPSEKQRLQALIEERFGLDPDEAASLSAKAEERDREAVDFYQFTSVLKHKLDDAGRQKIVEMLWEIAFADGVIHEFEENAIWRIAELLGVSTRERVMLRQKVMAQSPRGLPLPGPWSGLGAKTKA